MYLFHWKAGKNEENYIHLRLEDPPVDSTTSESKLCSVLSCCSGQKFTTELQNLRRFVFVESKMNSARCYYDNLH